MKVYNEWVGQMADPKYLEADEGRKERRRNKYANIIY